MYSFLAQTDEKILKKGLASLEVEDTTLSGALYVTNARLIFVGYILGGPAIKKEIAFPLTEITSVSGGKTALIIPNAIDVTTATHDRFRIVLRDRNAWIEAIRNQLPASG